MGLRFRVRGPKKRADDRGLGSYSDPTDPEGVDRHDTGSRAESLWQNLPKDPSFAYPYVTPSIFTFEDATDIDITDKWTQVKTDESLVPAILNKRGGGVGLAVGNVTGKSYNFLERRNQNVELDSSSELWLEFEIKAYDPSSISVAAIQIGLSDGATPGNVDDPDFDPNNPLGFNDAVYIDVFQTGRGAFYVGANARVKLYSGGTLTDNDAIALADNDADYNFDLSKGYRKIGLHIAPDGTGTHSVSVFDGETHVASIDGYSLPTTAMGVYFGSYSHNDRVIVRKIILMQGQNDEEKGGLDMDE